MASEASGCGCPEAIFETTLLRTLGNTTFNVTCGFTTILIHSLKRFDFYLSRHISKPIETDLKKLLRTKSKWL